MAKLEYSPSFNRVIRADDWNQIGISTWSEIKKAIEMGRSQEAVELVDYLKIEGKRLHSVMCDGFWGLLTYVSDSFGEEQVYEMLRFAGSKQMQKSAPSVEDTVRLFAETMRSNRVGPDEMGDFIVREERDRYVMILDPCGSGGRMRRTGRMEPPFNYGKTKKAYPWSWGKAGVPYYCTHCAVWAEILPIESQGYPVRVTKYNEDPDAPCTWYFYKIPEQIPEEYFARVGKVKDPSKLRKSPK